MRLGAAARGDRASLALALALFAVASLIALFPLNDTDLWWHLASGRWIVEHRALPGADPFGAVTGGRPWADVHWLFQLGALALYRLAGLSALGFAKAALVGAGAVLLLRAAGARGAAAHACVVPSLALALLSVRHLLLVRPVIVTLLFAAVFLVLLERFARDGRPRILLVLLPLQALWVNVQPLWPLGPFLLGAYLGGAVAQRLASKGQPDPHPRWRPLAFALVGVALACLATPLGLEGLAVPFRHLGRIEPGPASLFSLNVSENVPAFLLERGGDTEIRPFKWLAAAAFASFLLRVRAPRFDRLLAVSGMLVPALMANRNVLPFVWVAAPLALANVLDFLGERLSRVPKAPAALAGLAASVLVAIPVARAAYSEPSLGAPGPFRLPLRSTELLDEMGVEGTVFCSIRYGGYLLFRLHPRVRPTIDGRLILQTPEEFREHLAVGDEPRRFDAYAARLGVRAVVLPVFAPDRYRRLVAYLYRSASWRMVHLDGFEALFLPAESRHPPGISLEEPRAVAALAAQVSAAWRPQGPLVEARALRGLAELLAELGLPSRAREVLSGLKGPAARVLEARCLYLEGRLTEARARAGAVLEADPGDVESLGLLALIALDEGRATESLDMARRALAENPRDPLAAQVLARLEGGRR
ncbi:MAG: tetratricopeptide repeat protein [Myxococcales bacterium]|nr:tetratricopeptide repeat protein [Myxococcales bacterium]